MAIKQMLMCVFKPELDLWEQIELAMLHRHDNIEMDTTRGHVTKT